MKVRRFPGGADRRPAVPANAEGRYGKYRDVLASSSLSSGSSRSGSTQRVMSWEVLTEEGALRTEDRKYSINAKYY
jgi:hypothetical protein